ncbi:MAG: hypothetical protein ACP5JC_04905 [Candidatus Micrarchaeia archaeon]
MGVEEDLRILKRILASIPVIQIPRNRSQTTIFLGRNALEHAVDYISRPSLFRKYVREAAIKLNNDEVKEIASRHGAFQKEPITDVLESILPPEDRFEELTQAIQATHPKLASKIRYAPEYHQLYALSMPDEVRYYSSKYTEIINLCKEILLVNQDENVLKVKKEAEKCLEFLKR